MQYHAIDHPFAPSTGLAAIRRVFSITPYNLFTTDSWSGSVSGAFLFFFASPGFAEFWGKVFFRGSTSLVIGAFWYKHLSCKMRERPKATIFSQNLTTRDNERHK